MINLDLHTHTNRSIDSIINPESLALKAIRLGIIPAITDHNRLTAEPSQFKLKGFRFIAGEEIRTDIGDLIGLYLNEEIPKDTPALEAIDLIHAQGGLAYLPHMYDATRKGISDPAIAKKADIIEVFNARSVIGGFNKKAEDFAKENNMVGAAGSDAHFLFEFGSTYTELPEFDFDDPKQLMRALPKARIVGRSAPFYVRGTTTLVKFWNKVFR